MTGRACRRRANCDWYWNTLLAQTRSTHYGRGSRRQLFYLAIVFNIYSTDSTVLHSLHISNSAKPETVLILCGVPTNSFICLICNIHFIPAAIYMDWYMCNCIFQSHNHSHRLNGLSFCGIDRYTSFTNHYLYNYVRHLEKRRKFGSINNFWWTPHLQVGFKLIFRQFKQKKKNRIGNMALSILISPFPRYKNGIQFEYNQTRTAKILILFFITSITTHFLIMWIHSFLLRVE